VVAIETRDVLPSFETLCIKLKKEGDRRGIAIEQNDNTKAFVAAQNKNSYTKTNGQKKRNNIVCFMCGERGHAKSQCPQAAERHNHIRKTTNSGSTFNFQKSMWCLDSGATSHLCCERELFTKFEMHTEMIGLVNAVFLEAEGKGDVKFQTQPLTLKNVLYVPKMHGYFMSVSRAVKNRCTVNFGLQNAKVMQDGECIVSANRIGNLYLFQSINSKCLSATVKDGVLLHKRYGHLNFSSLREIVSKGMVWKM